MIYDVIKIKQQKNLLNVSHIHMLKTRKYLHKFEFWHDKIIRLCICIHHLSEIQIIK